jgi:hypothetical protein
MPMKEYVQPDLFKPKYRKNLLKLLNQAFYNEYRQKYPDTKLSDKQIISIVKTFNKECLKVIASTRDGLDIYNQLGFIFVGACKIQNPAEDHIKSKETGLEIHYKNWNTNEWICKVCYTNYSSKYRFKNAAFWGFEPNSLLKRAVSEAFKLNHKLYVITDNFRKLNRLFQKRNHRFWEHHKDLVIQHYREQEQELKEKEENN